MDEQGRFNREIEGGTQQASELVQTRITRHKSKFGNGISGCLIAAPCTLCGKKDHVLQVPRGLQTIVHQVRILEQAPNIVQNISRYIEENESVLAGVAGAMGMTVDDLAGNVQGLCGKKDHVLQVPRGLQTIVHQVQAGGGRCELIRQAKRPNAELEQLRGQLDQAVQEQEKLNHAIDAMPVLRSHPVWHPVAPSYGSHSVLPAGTALSPYP